MDKEYIIKHNLMEAHKQFMRLSEGYLATSIAEDDKDDEMNNQPEGPMDNNMENPEQQQGQDNGMPQQPVNNEGMPADMGNEGDIDNIGDTPQPMPGLDMPEQETEDDVIDVEQLTQAQEKLNKKQNSLGHDLGEVDDRIVALLTAVEKIQGSLEKNNNDITSLKHELERRVPTDTEKLNMQSLKMYPYNVSPNEYWKDKEKDGRYEAEDKEDKEYKIRRDDVNDYTDRDIENSFDDELNQTMKDIFKDF